METEQVAGVFNSQHGDYPDMFRILWHMTECFVCFHCEIHRVPSELFPGQTWASCVSHGSEWRQLG